MACVEAEAAPFDEADDGADCEHDESLDEHDEPKHRDENNWI